jgi:GTP cyclohydrolase II
LVGGEPATASERPLVRVAVMDPGADPLLVKPEVEAALRAIDEAGCGVFVYVFSRSRASLARSFDKLTAPRTGGPAKLETSEALRDFGLGAQVLAQLGMKNLRLLTNNPTRIVGLEGYGMHVVERVPIGEASGASRGASGEAVPSRMPGSIDVRSNVRPLKKES